MEPAESEKNISWVREFREALRPHGTAEIFPNFAGGEELDRVRAAYGPNLARLMEVKRRWDPGNVFRGNLNIMRTERRSDRDWTDISEPVELDTIDKAGTGETRYVAFAVG